MLARVIRAPLCPAQREAALCLYERLLPTLRAQPGFVSALLLTDHSTGQAVSLTLWDEATMEVDPALFRRHLALFEPFVADAFSVDLYEVSAATPLPLAACALLPSRPAGCP